jgi:hypothetical protein
LPEAWASSYIHEFDMETERIVTDLPPLSFAVMVLEKALVVRDSILAINKHPVIETLARIPILGGVVCFIWQGSRWCERRTQTLVAELELVEQL